MFLFLLCLNSVMQSLCCPHDTDCSFGFFFCVHLKCCVDFFRFLVAVWLFCNGHSLFIFFLLILDQFPVKFLVWMMIILVSFWWVLHSLNGMWAWFLFQSPCVLKVKYFFYYVYVLVVYVHVCVCGYCFCCIGHILDKR